jgi:hypothetical protein
VEVATLPVWVKKLLRPDAEEDDADHVELLASYESGEIGALRQNDGVGDEIRGEHPCGLILRST